jgi:dynein heavy chain
MSSKVMLLYSAARALMSSLQFFCCRLASFICGYEVFQIAVSSSYGVTEFKENLLTLYTMAGAKGIPVTFLMTDNQIVKEKFLVYINDLLSTGYIADLCTQARGRF